MSEATEPIHGEAGPGRWHYGYSIPRRWFRLPLDAGARAAQVAVQFDAQLGDTRMAANRGEWLAMLDGYATDAVAAGAVDAAVLLDIVDRMIVTAQLMVQIVDRVRPGDEDAELLAVTGELIAPRSNDLRERRLGWVDLPAGRAVHVRAVVDAQARVAPTEHDRGNAVLVDQYWIPVPGHRHVLVIGLSSPHLALEDLLAKTTAAIADSVTLTG